MFLGSGSIQKKKKKKKKNKRKEFGHFHTLFQELKEDREQFFFRYIRMSPNDVIICWA